MSPILAAIVDRPFQDARATIAAAQCERCAYTIGAGPLDGALRRFSQTSGVAIVADPDLLEGKTTHGASGYLLPKEALAAILKGTDTRAVFLDAHTARIEATVIAVVSTHATGSDYNRGRTANGKLGGALVDVPQTVTVVTQKTMKDEGVGSVRDALRNVSGIALAAGEGGSQGDSLTIRGFDAKNDFYLDGMRDYGNYYRDAFDLQQVEVSQGAAGAIFGRGSTGGTIDQISKRPNLAGESSLALVGGTAEMRRSTGDFDWKLSDTSAFRLNLMGQHSEIAERDVAATNRWGIAPSISFGLGTGHTLTVSYFHLGENDIPDYGLPLLWGKPAPVDRTNFYGFANADFYRDTTDIGTVAFESELNATTDLRTQIRYASYDHDISATNGTFSTQPPLGTPLDAISVNRTTHARSGHETFLEEQTDVTKHLYGGSTLRAGFEIGSETSLERTTRYTGLPTTSLVSPDPYQAMTYTSAALSGTNATAGDLGLYALYTTDEDKHWVLQGGGRYDGFDATIVDPFGGTTQEQPIDMLSGRASIMWKPSASGTVYLSWGTSFDPAIEALTVRGVPTPPEGNQVYELGSKFDFAHGALSVAAAVFAETKTNAKQTDLSGVTENIGLVRSQGETVSLSGRLSRDWQATAGLTFLNTLVAYSANPGETGNPLANTPHTSFTFFTTYQLTPRLEAGLGGSFVGKRFTTDTTNGLVGFTNYVPGYARYDAMAKYAVSKKFALQLNAYNLANAEYIDMVHPDHLVPGAGRTFQLTADMKL